jgi:hypothetical protein
LEQARQVFISESSGTNGPTKADQNQLGEGQEIKALLSPEQATASKAFQKEDQVRKARLSANFELIQLQSALQLDEAQQDKVFAVLVEQAQARLAGLQAGSDGAADVREQLEKAEALRPLLTPEQLSKYQQFQSSN